MTKLHKPELPPRKDKRYKPSRKQRLQHGVSLWDAYSLDEYLVYVIANGCRMLAEKGAGCGRDIYEELGMEPDGSGNYSLEQMNAAEAYWNRILESIASGLEAGLEACRQCEAQDSLHYQLFHEAFELLHKHFFGLWF